MLRKFAKSELNRLLAHLRSLGFTVLGPKIEEEAIVYKQVDSLTDLPRGYGDSQQPGKYRLLQAEHQYHFEFNLGPHSWKQFLFPPRVSLSTAQLDSTGWTFETQHQPVPKLAFLGVRACELAAIGVQDRVFLHGPYVDPIYKSRREAVLIIAVNCTVAAATCFCTSMQTGPKCQTGFDLALTELEACFVVEVGSPRGAEILKAIDTQSATPVDIELTLARQQGAVEQIKKTMDTTDIRNVLLDNLEHPHWDAVAERCLSCTNCTMVCPTCFCSSVSEVADLAGEHVERQRQWDSCFNVDFSYTASGTVRNDRRSRFRQWLTHKLATWHDQFESSGCVGCGRCITWCPVGIDLTEEVAALREQPKANRRLPVVQPPPTACQLPRSTENRGGSVSAEEAR